MTLTPSCFARATISTRLRAETAWAILQSRISTRMRVSFKIGRCLLGSVGAVVHEQEVEVAGVVDKEGLVAGGHHVAGLLVAAVADLCDVSRQRPYLQTPPRRANVPASSVQQRCPCLQNPPSPTSIFPIFPHFLPCIGSTHLRHSSLTLEPSPDPVVNAMRLPPARGDTFEAVALVTLELRSALLDDRDVALGGGHLQRS